MKPAQSAAFVCKCMEHGLPRPLQEYKFHPTRRWRFDFCWEDVNIAVEIDGGVFVRGRHSRGIGQIKDMEKGNAAILYGWRVLHYTPSTIDYAQIAEVYSQCQSKK